MKAMLLAVAAAVAMTSSPPAPKVLTDADLVAFASTPFKPGNTIPSSYVLGVHHGAKVMVEFRCGDICPQYTSRHIHYDVEPGPACDKVGGRARTESFVQGIGVTRKDFCVPAILVDRKLQ